MLRLIQKNVLQQQQQQQQQQNLQGKKLFKRSSLKFPPLHFGARINESISNKDNSLIFSSKSTYLDNASFIGGGGGGGSTNDSGSNILIDKNTINASIVFSLQDSIPS